MIQDVAMMDSIDSFNGRFKIKELSVIL